MCVLDGEPNNRETDQKDRVRPSANTRQETECFDSRAEYFAAHLVPHIPVDVGSVNPYEAWEEPNSEERVVREEVREGAFGETELLERVQTLPSAWPSQWFQTFSRPVLGCIEAEQATYQSQVRQMLGPRSV